MADDLDWVNDYLFGDDDDNSDGDDFDDWAGYYNSFPTDGGSIPGDEYFGGTPITEESFNNPDTGSTDSGSVTIELPETDTGTDSGSGSSNEPAPTPSPISSADQEPVIDDSFIVDDNYILQEQKRDSNITELGYDENRPFWEVYIDGYYGSQTKKLIHRSGIDDTSRLILNPSLELTINDAGSFSFTILPNHLYYNDIEPMYTDIFVYSEGVELFRGRVTNYTVDINRQKSVTCEGDLGYLSDAIFKLYNGEKKTKKVYAFFKDVIEAYNSAVSVTYGSISGDENVTRRRTFAEGITSNIQDMVAKNKQDPTVTVEETAYKDAKSYIDELISTYGGYVRTKRLNTGTVVVEYLDSYTAKNPQVIYYGGTLQSMSISNSPGDICTVLIPEGDAPEDSSGSSKKENITLSSAKAYKDGGFVHSAKSDELVWADGVVKYGRIMKVQSFNGITKANSLLTRSILFMKEMIKTIEGSITVKALDMHLLNKEWRPIYIGDSLVVESTLHRFRKEMMCMGIRYDLTSPENTEYTLSVPYHMLSGSFSKQYKNNKKKTDTNVKKANTKASVANAKASDAQSTASNALSKISALESKFDNIGKEVGTDLLKVKTIKFSGATFKTTSILPSTFKLRYTGSSVAFHNDLDDKTYRIPIMKEDPDGGGGYVFPMQLQYEDYKVVITGTRDV